MSGNVGAIHSIDHPTYTAAAVISTKPHGHSQRFQTDRFNEAAAVSAELIHVADDYQMIRSLASMRSRDSHHDNYEPTRQTQRRGPASTSRERGAKTVGTVGCACCTVPTSRKS